jgi:hypothetical protein
MADIVDLLGSDVSSCHPLHERPAPISTPHACTFRNLAFPRSGQNLGCVTGVYFGQVPAKTFSNPATLLYCGATGQVDAVAPPGQAHAKVKVTVTTIESDFTGSGPSRSTAFFTYRR